MNAPAPLIWKPTKFECEQIKRAAVLESQPGVKAVKLEPGIRHNCVPGNGGKPESINIARVTAMRDGTWGDTDLSDYSTWMSFKRGVELTEGGKAIIDFYIYSPRGVDHLGLLGNLVVCYENGQLTSLRGGHSNGQEYLQVGGGA